MNIVFQRPGLGEDEHDYRWSLVNAAGERVSSHYSPEAALLRASGVLGVEVATLRLVRDGADRFNVEQR